MREYEAQLLHELDKLEDEIYHAEYLIELEETIELQLKLNELYNKKHIVEMKLNSVYRDDDRDI